MLPSFIRGLTASITRNTSSLKRQAKRLFKASPTVFGVQFTLEQCQEAIANANGFKCWNDVVNLSHKYGSDKSNPFWVIQSRNDDHEKVLSALVSVGADAIEHRPLAVLGELDKAALVATCLWFENISHQKTPGLILIETDHATVEDTEIGRAFTLLDRHDELSRFRVIDARQSVIPVDISALPRDWARAISDLLSSEDSNEFKNSGGHHLFASLIEAFSINSNWTGNVGAWAVESAARWINNPEWLKTLLLTTNNKKNLPENLEDDIDRYADKLPEHIVQKVRNIVASVAERKAEVGVSIWQESQSTPTIVLFSRKDPASAVMASLVHSMFYWRYVSSRTTRTILYFNDSGVTSFPAILAFGEKTILVNGLVSTHGLPEENSILNRALISSVAGSQFSFSGRKAKFE